MTNVCGDKLNVVMLTIFEYIEGVCMVSMRVKIRNTYSVLEKVMRTSVRYERLVCALNKNNGMRDIILL